MYDESDPDEDFELAIELYRCLKKGENEPDPIVMGIWVQTGSPDDQRRILPMAPVGHIEKVHEDWMARSEPRPEHPLIPLVKAWQKWKVSRGAPLRERHLHVLDNGAKPLARSPGLLNHAVLSDIEAVEVDGLPVATAMASPLIAYRQRRGPKDPQIPLLPYPATLEGEPVGDVIIASMSNYPLTRDERNPLRGDIYRLGSFVFAVTGSTAIPEDLGAHFLTGGVSEAAKRRWWATVETLRAIVLRVNPRTGAFLDLAIASIDRDGTAHLAPPLWWRGKHAWRLTGGLFRPALADNADSERGPDAGYWGGLNRTIAGIEAALAWGPTAGRGRQGRIPDWLKPANGRTGPGAFCLCTLAKCAGARRGTCGGRYAPQELNRGASISPAKGCPARGGLLRRRQGSAGKRHDRNRPGNWWPRQEGTPGPARSGNVSPRGGREEGSGWQELDADTGGASL